MAIPQGVSPVGWMVGWAIWVDIWLAVAATGIYFIESNYDIMFTLLHFFLYLIYPVYSIMMYVLVWWYQVFFCAAFRISQNILNEGITLLNWAANQFGWVKDEVQYIALEYEKSEIPNSGIYGRIYKYFYGSSSKPPPTAAQKKEWIAKFHAIPSGCPGSKYCVEHQPVTNPYSIPYYMCAKDTTCSNQTSCLTPKPSQFNTSTGGFK